MEEHSHTSSRPENSFSSLASTRGNSPVRCVFAELQETSSANSMDLVAAYLDSESDRLYEVPRETGAGVGLPGNDPTHGFIERVRSPPCATKTNDAEATHRKSVEAHQNPLPGTDVQDQPADIDHQVKPCLFQEQDWPKRAEKLALSAFLHNEKITSDQQRIGYDAPQMLQSLSGHSDIEQPGNIFEMPFHLNCQGQASNLDFLDAFDLPVLTAYPVLAKTPADDGRPGGPARALTSWRSASTSPVASSQPKRRRAYLCPLCWQRFAHPRDLYRHLNESCNQTHRYICPDQHCSRPPFKRAERFRQHHRWTHFCRENTKGADCIHDTLARRPLSTRKALACGICEFKCSLNKDFASHLCREHWWKGHGKDDWDNKIKLRNLWEYRISVQELIDPRVGNPCRIALLDDTVTMQEIIHLEYDDDTEVIALASALLCTKGQPEGGSEDRHQDSGHTHASQKSQDNKADAILPVSLKEGIIRVRLKSETGDLGLPV